MGRIRGAYYDGEKTAASFKVTDGDDLGVKRNIQSAAQSPANTKRWTHAVLMLVQCRRRWASIKTALGQRFVFTQSTPTLDSRNGV